MVKLPDSIVTDILATIYKFIDARATTSIPYYFLFYPLLLTFYVKVTYPCVAIGAKFNITYFYTEYFYSYYLTIKQLFYSNLLTTADEVKAKVI